MLFSLTKTIELLGYPHFRKPPFHCLQDEIWWVTSPMNFSSLDTRALVIRTFEKNPNFGPIIRKRTFLISMNPIGSMYAIYGNFTINIPPMLASIYHTWILWECISNEIVDFYRSFWTHHKSLEGISLPTRISVELVGAWTPGLTIVSCLSQTWMVD